MGINRPAAYGVSVATYAIKDMRKDGFTFSDPQTKDWGEGRTSTSVLIQNKQINFSCYAALTNENFTVLEVREAGNDVEKYNIKAGDKKGYLV